MFSKKAEPHNAEFVALWRKSGMTQSAIAEALGVSLMAVKSWCVDENSEMFRPCPIFRVYAFKVVLGLKLKSLSDNQRAELLDVLRSI
jgi:hypothetical protein